MAPSRSPPSSPKRPTKMTKVDESLDIEEATTAVIAEASYRPDAKARRYDRQLRLWASAGQRSLETARILLVGTDATGCQALKNLVLPGIAHFTILSDKITTQEDVSTNFFLHPDSIGSSAAAEEVKFLKELNPSVDGTACIENVKQLLATNPEFFLSYTLIIVSGAEPQVEAQIAELLWKASEVIGGPDIPLIAVRSSGFIGRIEIQLREHCVVDTHPDQTHTLRIDQPFPSLEEYARKLDLASMDSMEHSHVPWVVLLVKAVVAWRDEHGRNPESNNDDDRVKFKALLKSWKAKADEENFDEALAQAYRAWNTTELDENVAMLLEEPSVKQISSGSKNLHILLHTLSRYLSAAPHLPPISPKLPDMHSSTASYIALQNLFKQQFLEDLARFRANLAETLATIGLAENAIPDEEVENFARNVTAVGIIKGSPLVERKRVGDLTKQTIQENFSSTGNCPNHLGMHLAITAAEQFYASSGRWPGSAPNEEVEADVTKLHELVSAIVNEAKLGVGQLGQGATHSIKEVVRGGFSCLPNVAAFLGGIVAQEAIKLVTNQYNPLDNTVIADLISSSLEKYRL